MCPVLDVEAAEKQKEKIKEDGKLLKKLEKEQDVRNPPPLPPLGTNLGSKDVPSLPPPYHHTRVHTHTHTMKATMQTVPGLPRSCFPSTPPCPTPPHWGAGEGERTGGASALSRACRRRRSPHSTLSLSLSLLIISI